MQRIVLALVGNLNHIVPVRPVCPFPCISCLPISCVVSIVVCVGASPLDVDILILRQVKELRHEVVLHSRVSLHDVASLALHHEIVDGGGSRDTSRTGVDTKDVRAILESTTSLCGVDSQSQSLFHSNVHSWIPTNRGLVSIESRVQIPWVISCGDIVTQT